MKITTPAPIIKKINELLEHKSNIPESILIGAGYDGQKRVAFLQFYDPKSQRVYFYYDRSGHKPYVYSLEPPSRLQFLKNREDVIDIKTESKIDLLNDRRIVVSKIVVSDPLAVSGTPGRKGIRNLIEAYEADITYYMNYIYDLQLHPGTFYKVVDDEIQPVVFETSGEIKSVLQKALSESSSEFHSYIREWAVLLNQPLPEIKRAALDIEVYTERIDRVPDPSKADQRIISVALVGSDGFRKVYVLKRTELELGEKRLPANVAMESFDSETEMLLTLFNDMLEYPLILTFNGDDFDLPYLYHRAIKLGIPREAIPISLGRNEAHIKHGVHVDLYKTFSNRSIQGYAFNNRYSEHTLNAVSLALLGKEKVEFEGSISELPLEMLAYYNYTDAELTYELSAFSNSLLIKLLLTIMRVAKMPLADVSRLSVSNWIRSLMIFEHRRIGALVPRKEDLQAKSAAASSKAIIKGKKYRGGFVIEPTPGVHFNVVVLDFASLYPSIIKVYNLSYETVRCPHEECRNDPSLRIPDTDHWRCKKRRGITSLLIGSLRDIRVDYFKSLAKRPGITKEEKEFYSVISQALKVILNASYGVMGFENFALYCLPVAEATAAYGRWAIEQTMKKAKEIGLDVIYGDTDSLFVKSPSEEQIKEITLWAKKTLEIDLEVDKVFRYVALSKRKKNYIGVYPDGKVEVKGLTGKKSNTPEYIKEVFNRTLEILSQVHSKEDFSKASEEIRKLVRQAYLDIKNRRVPVDKLAFRVMLSKPLEQYKDTTPQHVKAAKLMRNMGREIKAGDVISYVKTTGGLGVKPLELARPEDIDVDKYIEYLRSTFEQLLDALGFSFEEIMGVSTIEEFFFA